MSTVKNRVARRNLTPERADLLEKLSNQPDPIGIFALTTLTGRHPNTLRDHLAGLMDAGLVIRHRAQHEGRGRPAWLYQAVGPGPSQTDHAEIAAALAWTLGETSGDVVVEATNAGRRRGRELCREHGIGHQQSEQDARARVVDVMEELGFAPEADQEVTRVRLTRCPLLQAAHTNEQIVCGMHEGLVQGVLDVCGAPAVDVALTPFAEPGACLLDLSDAGAAAAP